MGVISFTPRSLHLLKKRRGCRLNSRLGGSQGPSEGFREEKNPLPGVRQYHNRSAPSPVAMPNEQSNDGGVKLSEVTESFTGSVMTDWLFEWLQVE